MDKAIITEKLESLRKCVLRLQEKAPLNVNILLQDIDLQDIISLNLSRAVQLSVDIGAHLVASLDITTPNTMGKVFDALVEAKLIEGETGLSLKKAVGFRNIAVHSYEKINWLIVDAIIKTKLSDFQQYAHQIDAYLTNIAANE